MMKQTICSALLAVAVAGTAFAGPVAPSPCKEYKQPCVTPCFRDTEWQLDLFYSYNDAVRGKHHRFAGDRERDYADFRLHDGSGGGVGLGYFFCRYVGVDVEGNWWGGGRRFEERAGLEHYKKRATSQLTGNLILRYPIEGSICWAPYIFGGGGGIWGGHRSHGFGDLGLGVEFRLTPYMGLFADWRWNFVGGRGGDVLDRGFGDFHGHRRSNVDTTRVGIRFVF